MPNEIPQHKRKKPDQNPIEKSISTHSVKRPAVETKTHEKRPAESRSRLEEVLALVPSPQDKERQQDRMGKEELLREQRLAHYKQIQELNKAPLNQAALQWLRKISKGTPGWTTSADQQYVFQLMFWGLEEAGLELPDPWQTEMFKNSLLRMMDAEDQNSSLRYLQGYPHPDAPLIDETDMENAEDAEMAAWRLIDALDSHMSSEPENNGIYPPQHPLRLDGD